MSFSLSLWDTLDHSLVAMEKCQCFLVLSVHLMTFWMMEKRHVFRALKTCLFPTFPRVNHIWPEKSNTTKSLMIWIQFSGWGIFEWALGTKCWLHQGHQGNQNPQSMVVANLSITSKDIFSSIQRTQDGESWKRLGNPTSISTMSAEKEEDSSHFWHLVFSIHWLKLKKL